MLFIAILLRPIVLFTDLPGKIFARILADDVLLIGLGTGHLPQFLEAFNNMLQFIQDMGSIVSIRKSFLFSTELETRVFLKDFWWKAVDAKIGVVNDIRDLGAHLNVSAHHIGTILTNRMIAALPKVQRLAWLPLLLCAKVDMALMGVLSGALYGCEATHASETPLSNLSAHLAKALHGDAPRR